MKKKEEMWIRMARYMAGEMEMKEEIDFRENVEKDGILNKELNLMEKSWTYINEQASPGDGNPGRAWAKLHDRLEADGLLEESHAAPGRRSHRPALRIAASVLLLLAIGIPTLWYGINRNNNASSELMQFSEKGVKTVDLPDGSRVFLNEGSEIHYPENFKQDRRVNLDGEAFFEVMSDPVNPFNVRSGKVIVSVLGTSFNVKEGGQQEDVEVFVESGKVKMAMDNSNEFITLETGDVGVAEASTLSRSKQSDPNYISWKTKDFKFVDARTW